MDELEARAQQIDTTTPHPARRYNYFLGGKDHFEADRESARFIEAVFPFVRVTTRENRNFLKSAVDFLANEAQIDQFLDIGTGLPTADNTHEVAQRINPSSRVVYVDNDPMVMTHARALLTSTDEGRSFYIEEDLKNPARILNHPDLNEILDLKRPVALMLVAVMHFIKEDDSAYKIVRQLLEAMPSGSFLVLSHMSIDSLSTEVQAMHNKNASEGKNDSYARTQEQVAEFFRGLDLVDPGIVLVSDWRSTVPLGKRPTPEQIACYGAVGRKP
ncbi:SAM-dependent methyltransferase [Winogradskya humida]|uniref:S-adenosyl methyltransferase n=1 Tax=Winogradskya humida TaxID=113566 RepID=A0ABQ4A817_9ACTN|nr:SAM-dependent methyltransferase [Actinoplanes humidus]GIE26938.1 hypothetical protein Ahu01nite_100400 [Actinoplanes humidus]